MLDAFLLLLASVCTVVGMAWFALVKEWHCMQARASEPLSALRQHKLRTLGGTSISLALIVCLITDHPKLSVAWLRSK